LKRHKKQQLKRKILKEGKMKNTRNESNPIFIVSQSKKFLWSHLFPNNEIIIKATNQSESLISNLLFHGCSVPCKMSFDEKETTKADMIISWATKEKLDITPKKNALRVALGLEPDICFWFKYDEGCMDKFDIIVGYPSWSEVHVNYFYSLHDRVHDLDNIKSFAEYKKKMTTVLRMNQPKLSHPIWPENRTLSFIASTFISNCVPFQRNDYIEGLIAEGIKIAHYGKCTFGKASIGGKSSLVKMETQQEYPFILAFENSLLDDYFTEKYFQSLTSQRSIIIYLGSRRVPSYYLPSSPKYKYFIHALDYSPKDMAQLMTSLLSNSTKFQEYLLWKNEDSVSDEFTKFNLEFNFQNVNGWICRTCEFYAKYYDYV
jgi:hypothetical protein